ncbi:MAG: archaetidylserine decarboxylase [Spirochaetota bacterium]|nr:archaetidylserine decarboxylase [Spirochaetota bacterium]
MILLFKILPIRFISKVTGILADLNLPKCLIKPLLSLYVKFFKVNIDEMIHPISHYSTFNDFFTRSINLSSRPISPDPNIIISPVDGTVVEYGNIINDKALQVKGVAYSIFELIINNDYSKRFLNGHFITIYLSPKDYHRIHIPYDGKSIAVEYNRGKLYPVNNIGLYKIKNLFVVNERLTTFFNTSFGLTALVKVGATNVGRIKTVYPLPWTKPEMKKKSLFSKLNNLSYKRGDELARFELGSTIILLFEKDKIDFLETLKSGDSLKMGQSIAQIKNPSAK